MAKFGRLLLAALFLAAGLFAAAPAQAQFPGQSSPCPLLSQAKIIAATTYLVSSADRCQFLVFTSAAAITVQLPAPGLIFGPTWATRLVPINGGTLSLVGLADQSGVVHKINLAASLAFSAGTGADLQILQDMNWWAVGLGGGTVQTFACANLTDFGTACRANTGASGHTLGFLDISNLWSAGQAVTPVTVTKSGSTFTPDFATGNIFRMTLDAVGMTLANPSNMVAGKCGVLELVQDGPGSRTITTWGSFWKFPTGGTKPTLTTTGNAVDSVSYCSTTASFIEASWLGNFQ